MPASALPPSPVSQPGVPLDRELVAFLRQAFRELYPGAEGDPPLSEIGAGGSVRRFFRVGTYPTSLVGMWSPDPPRDARGVTENESFTYVARHLASCGVPVPRVLAEDLAHGWFALEDVGPVLLHDLVTERGEGARVELLYRRVVEVLLDLQAGGTASFDPARTHNPRYDGGFARHFESGYFQKRFVAPWLSGEVGAAMVRSGLVPQGQVAPGAPASLDLASLDGELDDLAREVDRLATDRCLVHRDLQSQNVAVRSDEVLLLDFQGARLGPAGYDVASLLLDPYARLSAALRARLLAAYLESRRNREPGFAVEPFLAAYPVVAAHRLMQAFGAYGFLSLERGRLHFLRHVPAAAAHLHELLVTCPALAGRPTLATLVEELMAWSRFLTG